MTHKKFTLLDGGMGRELERIGAPFQQPEWSALALMQSPDHVLQAHNNFIAAGADIITTNAYAVVPFHIGDKRFAADGFSLAQSAAKIADKAKQNSDKDIKIAGCIPPLFGSYRPDAFNTDHAADIIAPLISAQAPYVDFWLIETVSSLTELNAAMNGLNHAKNDKDIWVSFNVAEDLNADKPATLRSGEDITQACKDAYKNRASAILLNCNTPEDTTIALRDIASICHKSSIPFGAYANNFTPVREAVQANEGINLIRTDIPPLSYRDITSQWLDMGASIIGGCCGIGPDHIQALNQMRQSPSIT